jgi:putative ABC transport system substrate-binding protein
LVSFLLRVIRYRGDSAPSSADLIELYKRAAHNIDAILRGAKPGDIPIYQATKFELSINLKTAKQLGLSVPRALVASADKVIE